MTDKVFSGSAAALDVCRIIQGVNCQKRIEFRTVRSRPSIDGAAAGKEV